MMSSWTLRTLKRQATQMKRQANILQASVAVAEKAATAAQVSADAARDNIETFISRERARLKLKVYPLRLQTVGLDRDKKWKARVEFEFTYHGRSEAFVDSVEAEMDVRGDQHPEPLFFQDILPFPSVVTAETKIEDVSFEVPDLSEATIDGITAGEKFVHLTVAIRYKDVFGRKRETTVYYLWSVRSNPRFSRWVEARCEGYNTET